MALLMISKPPFYTMIWTQLFSPPSNKRIISTSPDLYHIKYEKNLRMCTPKTAPARSGRLPAGRTALPVIAAKLARFPFRCGRFSVTIPGSTEDICLSRYSFWWSSELCVLYQTTRPITGWQASMFSSRKIRGPCCSRQKPFTMFPRTDQTWMRRLVILPALDWYMMSTVRPRYLVGI